MEKNNENISNLKIDKIFDNTYGDIDYDNFSKVDFIVDSNFHSYENLQDDLQDILIFKKIHELIENSKFSVKHLTGKKTKHRRLNKFEINEVYEYISNNLTNVRKIDIFSHLTDYFDITSTKFYSSLSNLYKNELINELDKITNILEKKNIKKLF